MNHKIQSEFLFALCNPGSEKALKLEAETMALGWRLSYQRRGFVTFKSDELFSLNSLVEPLAFARRICLSLGKFNTRDDAVRALDSHSIHCIHHARFHERKMQGVQGNDLSQKPKAGDGIGTIVELGASEFWVGIHQHAAFLSPDPAGDAGIVMAEHSPSRAWLKLEEAVHFLDIHFSKSDIVAELGCAPGGVVLALLDRGISVIGVDPAKMADVVMKSAIADRENPPRNRPWFFHCRKPAALTSKRDLGQDVTWFMSDMNQSPEVVLSECQRFCKMAPSIRGVLITLKLTDLNQIIDKSKWFTSLRSIGFNTIRLQQLSVHHKELALFALK
jgi:23S rRNA (cytidine2498-2'-O)-methyltransferase